MHVQLIKNWHNLKQAAYVAHMKIYNRQIYFDVNFFLMFV